MSRVAVGVVVSRHHEPLAGPGQDLGHLGPGGVAAGGDAAHAPSGGVVTSSISFESRAASCWVES